jgi:hypothetical protein
MGGVLDDDGFPSSAAVTTLVGLVVSGAAGLGRRIISVCNLNSATLSKARVPHTCPQAG